MQVRTKNIAVIALAVVFVLVLWQHFIYSSMASQASKANEAAAGAQTNVQTLQSQLRKLSGSADGKSHKASDEELQNAIPATAAVSTFLRSIDNVRILSGVSFQSIVPTPATVATGVASINLGITVQGSYDAVQNYQDRLMKLSRLLVVDNVSLTPGGTQGGAVSSEGAPVGPVFAGQGAAPTMQLQLTARLFTQQVGAVGGTGATGTVTQPATPPAAAPAPGVQNS